MDFWDQDIRSIINSVRYGTVLDEVHLITILYNILCAFNFLHSTGIVHRDVKPGNLLMDSNCQVKICDFGLARRLPDRISQFSLTSVGKKMARELNFFDDEI
jgi:serine/threonine protein kinase